MGSVCCCLSFDDFEDYVNPNSPVYRNCACLSCLIQNVLNVVCLHNSHSISLPLSRFVSFPLSCSWKGDALCYVLLYII